MFEEFKKLEKNFFDDIGRMLSSDYKKPLSDITQNANEVLINIKLFGVDKKDVKLHISRNFVEVQADVKKKNIKKSKSEYSESESYKGFYRKIHLPKGLDIDNAEAKFTKDNLNIKIPKIYANNYF